ncbi:MAG: hypothetical protein AAGC53_03030 [Actinomycetota bacterium]
MSERLNDEAVERIVRRALELDGDPTADDQRPSGFDVNAVIAAAEEVGISRGAVLESVARERLGNGPPSQTLDPMFGSRWVVVERRVDASAGVCFDRLDEWLTTGHQLRRETRHGTTGVWHRRRDVAAGLQRGVRGVTGGARLGTVSIAGHVVGVDDRHSIVRLMVDRAPSRSRHVGVATASGVSGIAAGVGFATVTPPLALIGVPVVAIAGVAASRSKRGARTIETELNRLLDQVSDGASPTSTFGIRLPRRRR